MYRIAIFNIRPELESTGYQINYPAGTGTGYLQFSECSCIMPYSDLIRLGVWHAVFQKE